MMDIINNNKNLLDNLHKQYPEAFVGININGNYLVFGNESIDVSEFNLYDLFQDINFANAVYVLKSNDIYKVIRCNVLYNNSYGEQKKPIINNGMPTILISENEFYSRISSGARLNPTQKREQNLFYSFIADCYKEQDYLDYNILGFVRVFENYVWALMEASPEDLNEAQIEAIRRYQEMTQQKMEQIKKEEKKEKEEKSLEQENVKVLKLVKKEDNMNNAAFISSLEVVWVIVGISIILTAITLLIVK